MIYEIIYLIGCIIAWIIIKFKIRNNFDRDWGIIAGAIVGSCLSWLFVMFYLGFATKPPKWL